MMSLAHAIIYGSVEQVAQIAGSYDSLEYIDEYGYNPLVQAAIMDDPEKLRILLSLGADPNYPDLTGRTALSWVVDNNHLDMAKQLLEQGADANHYTTAAEPLLTMPLLRQQTQMKQLLLAHGANREFAQDYINAKLLGHRFELKGHVDIFNPDKNELVEVEYDGFYPEFTLMVIHQSLRQFIRHFAARNLRDYFPYIEKILSVIHDAGQLAKFQQYNTNLEQHKRQINSILRKEVILIPLSFVGHAITLIQRGPILIRCDRGEYGRKHGSVIVYSVGCPQELTPEFYQSYLYQQNSLEKINQALTVTLQLKPIATIELPVQTMGNCSWANIEAAVPALLFLYIWQNSRRDTVINIPAYAEQALTIYYAWLRWDQDRALEREIYALKSAETARSMTKAALLAAVLFQQVDYQEDRDLARAEQILNAISGDEFAYILKFYQEKFVGQRQTRLGKNLIDLLEHHGIDMIAWRQK